jgi:Fe-Mn family superoxide dismutase
MTMPVQTLPLPFDAEAVPGLSAKLLRSHHATNYGGAVKRLNAIRAELARLDPASAPGFAWNGLKREELIATNSMLLHELYFASLAATPQAMEPACALALAANFGSVERWQAEFSACAKAQAGGSGWLLLTFQPREGTLVNQWAADHTHAVAGGVPLLALDMYEHAYHMDYGAGAAAYVDACMAAIDWPAVYERYQAAVHAASERFACSADEVGDALLIDVRRAGVFARAPTMIAGAGHRDPQQVAEWGGELEAGRPVVVYCVYGHEVGRATALRLRAAGHDARFLRGGIADWESSGRPLRSRPGPEAP